MSHYDFLLRGRFDKLVSAALIYRNTVLYNDSSLGACCHDLNRLIDVARSAALCGIYNFRFDMSFYMVLLLSYFVQIKQFLYFFRLLKMNK